ncbi:hypothetical protein Q4534_01095 [Cyclobacterium sp. 1_MG-2023]|uniref:hypothetical protein n=1 Tax=Cyclobacterium sp. 1_MG-2023 TaxID=3062681 RepID=UPI0026E279E1|nr:hypothetical protein [Cyclobacterium sp. 1_MG-2023]MDO6435975.1 hypothetical protein [Cyclobacterium sp. 1_MG-2023]
MAIVWFEGGAHGPEQRGPDVLSIFDKYQPNGLFYHNLQRANIRWGGSESEKVPYPCRVTPDPEGLLPELDVKRLKEWGKEIKKRFSNPIAKSSGSGNIFSLTLPSKATIDHVVIMENIRHGERIRSFSLKGKLDSNWVNIFNGIEIGHKLIVPFSPENNTEIKLEIDHSKGDVQVLSFEVYNSKKRL